MSIICELNSRPPTKKKKRRLFPKGKDNWELINLPDEELDYNNKKRYE